MCSFQQEYFPCSEKGNFNFSRKLIISKVILYFYKNVSHPTEFLQYLLKIVYILHKFLAYSTKIFHLYLQKYSYSKHNLFLRKHNIFYKTFYPQEESFKFSTKIHNSTKIIRFLQTPFIICYKKSSIFHENYYQEHLIMLYQLCCPLRRTVL